MRVLSALMQSMSDLPDDIEILKQIVIEQRSRLLSNTLQIEQLKLQLAKLRRMQFGRSSEQIDAQIAQLELTLEDLEVRSAATSLSLLAIPAASISTAPVASLPSCVPASVSSRVSPTRTRWSSAAASGPTGRALAELGRFGHLVAPGYGDITAGASPKSARLEQPMQVNGASVETRGDPSGS